MTMVTKKATKKETEKENRTLNETKNKCQIETKEFTEKDFKNPPPLEKRSLEYIVARGLWEHDNGLTKKFDNIKDAIKWFDKL